MDSDSSVTDYMRTAVVVDMDSDIRMDSDSFDCSSADSEVLHMHQHLEYNVLPCLHMVILLQEEKPVVESVADKDSGYIHMDLDSDSFVVV